jgi:hypothetical protein
MSDSTVYVHQLNDNDVLSKSMKKALENLHNRRKSSSTFSNGGGSSKTVTSAYSNRRVLSSSTKRTFDDLNFDNLHLTESRRSGGKKRANGRRPPPAPSMLPVFPIHTPPCSPSKSSTKLLRRLIPFHDDSDVNIGPEFSIPESPATPATPHRFIPNSPLTWTLNYSDDTSPHFTPKPLKFQSNAISFDEFESGVLYRDPPVQSEAPKEFEDPDLSEVEHLCNRYYPHVLKRHAPTIEEEMQCSAQDCLGDANSPLYHCQTCFCTRWFCKDCIKKIHKCNPLHRIVEWDRENFRLVPKRLYDLGLTLRFKSITGRPCHCSSHEANHRDLEVVHTDGVHTIRYILCYCEQIKNPKTVSPEQLLTNNLWPATEKEPARAFTFEVLQRFDVMNLFGYINIKQFLDGTLSMSQDEEQVCLVSQFMLL